MKTSIVKKAKALFQVLVFSLIIMLGLIKTPLHLGFISKLGVFGDLMLIFSSLSIGLLVVSCINNTLAVMISNVLKE